MSKERRQRREAREREAAILAAARAAEAERKERRAARMAVVTQRLPKPRPRPNSILEQRRRQQIGMLVAILLFLNVLVWIFVPGWAARFGALFVSLLAAPVLFTLMFRRT
jgi:hypothetical protein